MKIPLYQVDAFTAEPFAGNPAAVCPLEFWLPDTRMQAIAAENNLSETAFLVRAGWAEDAAVDRGGAEENAGRGMEATDRGGVGPGAGSGTREGKPTLRYELRWFTPVAEVDLCGHATLASAWVLLERLVPGAEKVVFETRSGPLLVRRAGDLYTMDFPARPAVPVAAPEALAGALGREPEEVLAAERDYLAVLSSEGKVRGLEPDLRSLARLERPGVIVTAPADPGPESGDADFVSRFFAPALGVPEDPVTGSAHCTLAPYWAERLGRRRLRGRQVSRRGGEVFCEARGARVTIGGRAVPYLEGTIELGG